ncbi:MAG: hypothetical protein LBH82_02135 [Bacteroidales bacterium]|jgi:hypothetical protein|nr:hypothetical protein [Bacteroidales bacterium]
MKQLTIQIPDNKYSFFLELLRSFDFVKFKTNTSDSDEAIEENIKKGVEELQLIKKGTLKSRPAREFLNEI